MIVIEQGQKFYSKGVAYTAGVPIFIWVTNETDVEEGAMVQLFQASNLPCVFHHVSAMPDVHQGYGLPIGGVVALDGCVSPFSVGNDIGCGMRSLGTNIPIESVTPELLIRLRREIRATIPMGGANVHKEIQEWPGFRQDASFQLTNNKVEHIRKSLGTLGGGK
jgi:tRNA-splicing ligase RtcB